MRRWVTLLMCGVLAFAVLAEAGAAERRREQQKRARRRIQQGDLKVGQEAPDFELRTLTSVLAQTGGKTGEEQDEAEKKTVKLSDCRGDVVVLLFSSYT